MSIGEINRLRKKFILVSTLSFVLVMFLMGGLICGFVLGNIRAEVRDIMEVIIQNGGELPEIRNIDKNDNRAQSSGVDREDSGHSGQHEKEDQGEFVFDMRSLEEQMKWGLSDFFNGDSVFSSPDFVYTTRYFSVIFDESGAVKDVKISHTASASEEQAEYYARIALSRFIRFGSFGSYYYQVAHTDDGGVIVVYLDRTSQTALTMRLFFSVLIFIGIGSAAVFFIMKQLSYRIIRPEIENAERQKQFITNASHELKTPLAVIRANTEMMEMISGESEWTQSNLRQVSRMEGLIQNLVMIARSQEQENNRDSFSQIDISVPVRESAQAFDSMASSQGKTLDIDVEDGIVIRAEDSRIRQLVSLLTDNAVKYCDDNGRIAVSLNREKKNAVLRVSNPYAGGSAEECKRFFERFYRSDASHNTDKGGYGIGLSLAEGLTRQMGGVITAEYSDGIIAFVCRFKGADPVT